MKVSRRTLVRATFWLLAAPLVAAFGSLLARQESVARRPRRVVIPEDGAETLAIQDEVVVSRGAQGVRVFAARCTHLGCRLTTVTDGLIVCPCHGSKFRADGTVHSGPASLPLPALAVETDAKTGELVVHVG